MNKGLIVYQSKYGATKKYAEWLHAATGFAMAETSQTSDSQLREAEVIVFCGGIYASGIAGFSFLRKRQSVLCGKKTAVFCVGASPYEEHALEEIRNRNFKGCLQHVPLFYGRGAWNPAEMTFKDRMMCKFLQKMVAKQQTTGSLEPWMEALLAAGNQSCDWTDRAYLEPLLAYLTT